MTFRSGLNYTIQQSSLPNPEPACEGQGGFLFSSISHSYAGITDTPGGKSTG